MDWVIVAGALGGAAFMGLVWLFFGLYQRLKIYGQRLAELEEITGIVENSKKRGRLHHSYNEYAAIEDIKALVARYVFNRRADDAMLETAIGILGVLRDNPKSYDPDQPAGRRPKGMDR